MKSTKTLTKTKWIASVVAYEKLGEKLKSRHRLRWLFCAQEEKQNTDRKLNYYDEELLLLMRLIWTISVEEEYN